MATTSIPAYSLRFRLLRLILLPRPVDQCMLSPSPCGKGCVRGTATAAAVFEARMGHAVQTLERRIGGGLVWDSFAHRPNGTSFLDGTDPFVYVLDYPFVAMVIGPLILCRGSVDYCAAHSLLRLGGAAYDSTGLALTTAIKQPEQASSPRILSIEKQRFDCNGEWPPARPPRHLAAGDRDACGGLSANSRACLWPSPVAGVRDIGEWPSHDPRLCAR